MISNYYNSSAWQAVMAVYPDYKWEHWRFHKVPQGYWEDKKHHKFFFDWLGKKLGIQELDDWYNIPPEQVDKNGGKGLMVNYFNSSLWTALKSVYPEHDWLMWKFHKVPKGYWEDTANQRKFFDWLGKKLGYTHLDDWYNITKDQIDKHGGAGLLAQCYNNSPWGALEAVYPEHEWQPWRYQKAPREYWKDEANFKKMFEWLERQLNIQSPEDWYRISLDQIQRVTNPTIIFKTGGLTKFLNQMYPDMKWDVDRMTLPKSILRPSQRILASHIQNLFPDKGECDSFGN